jgi:outer membrane protein assembly factor BamB
LGDTPPEVALEGSSILLLTEESSVGKLTKLTLSGTQRFKKNADIEGSPDGVVPVGAVVAGGRFIYANGDRILAYNTDNGNQSWIYTPTARISTYGYDLVATADAVIVSHDERVIKLNVADRALLWEQDIKSAPCNSDLGPNTAATDGNTIAVTGVCDQEVVGLDYASGTEKWRNLSSQHYHPLCWPLETSIYRRPVHLAHPAFTSHIRSLTDCRKTWIKAAP